MNVAPNKEAATCFVCGKVVEKYWRGTTLVLPAEQDMCKCPVYINAKT